MRPTSAAAVLPIAEAGEDGQAVALAYLKSRPGFLFKRTQQLANAFFMRPAGADITQGQFEALAAIAARPEVDQITLAGLLGIDRSTTTVVLDGLMNRGLIERRVDSDRRRRRLCGTAAASRALAAARRRSDEAEERLLGVLMPPERVRLIDLLGRVAAMPATGAPPWRGVARWHEEGVAVPELAWIFDRLAFGARRASQIMNAIFLDELAEFNITTGQYAVMVMISAAGALDQVSLAALIGADRSTTAVLIRLLEARGVVRRERAEDDRRRRLAVISAAGRELLLELLPYADNAERRLLAPLDAADRDMLFALMGRVIGAHDALAVVVRE